MGVATAFQQLGSIGSLAQSDPSRDLANLNPHVVGEDAKVAHLKDFLHLCLERLNLNPVGTRNHKVINKNVDD